MNSSSEHATQQSVVYLANPNSPHVRQWLELNLLPSSTKLYHIGSHKEEFELTPDVDPIAAIPVILQWLPNQLKYLILGLLLRITLPSSTIIHAHNTSGFGLAALVSGRHFIVTTYGTEIYSLPRRGKLYRWLLRKVLIKAHTITSTSSEMTQALICINQAFADKIETFSLGVSDVFVESKRAQPKPRNYKVWLVNRRIHPHYDTDVLIDAFAEFIENGGTGRLVLTRGDADLDFLDKVKEKVKKIPEVILVDKFLSRNEMISYLDHADFCVSIPKTDQLSSSILEGMARGCIPILSPLGTYISENLGAIFITEKPIGVGLRNVFEVTSKMSDDDITHLRNSVQEKIHTKYTKDSARKRYLSILRDTQALKERT